jgi:hypothetical protein
MKTQEWSKPYCGLSHFGNLSDFRRVTVTEYKTEYENFYILHRITKGCGFHSVDSKYKTVDEAKEAGERWVIRNND